MLLGEGLVGVNHCAIPTSTHKEGNQKSIPCNKFVTQLLPYVHATGLANFNTSIPYIHNYPTSMTLISPPLYLKTIIKHQINHSIQFTFYDSFYYTQLGCPSFKDQFYNHSKYHAVLEDSQNDISEAWEINNFYKIKPPPCSKRYKWSTRAKLSSSKDISEAHRVF